MEDNLREAPLPPLNGVAASRLSLTCGPWSTVLEFLIERHPRVDTATWISRIEKGQILDERGRCLHLKSEYRAGGCIYYYREVDAERRIPFIENILYQDEQLLVADKPHFLPVIPAGRFLQETLVVRLRRKTGLQHLTPIHRIDRETAGIVLFSLNPKTRGNYASLFQCRAVRKEYEALAGFSTNIHFPLKRRSRIVTGEPFFRMKEIAGSPNSETCLSLIEQKNGIGRYQITLLTGKKHQIRVHLSAIGIGILNDRLYPERSREQEEDDYSQPLKLLAKSIAFKDPLNGSERYFESSGRL